jgi:hypothetical protein
VKRGTGSQYLGQLPQEDRLLLVVRVRLTCRFEAARAPEPGFDLGHRFCLVVLVAYCEKGLRESGAPPPHRCLVLRMDHGADNIGREIDAAERRA